MENNKIDPWTAVFNHYDAMTRIASFLQSDYLIDINLLTVNKNCSLVAIKGSAFLTQLYLNNCLNITKSLFPKNTDCILQIQNNIDVHCTVCNKTIFKHTFHK